MSYSDRKRNDFWKNASFLQSFANLCIISCRLVGDVVLFQWQKDCIILINTVVINMTYLSYFFNIWTGENNVRENDESKFQKRPGNSHYGERFV